MIPEGRRGGIEKSKKFEIISVVDAEPHLTTVTN